MRAGGKLRQSIGIETRGGIFTRLINKGSPLPVSRTEVFTTADPGQPQIKIKVFGGERRLVAKNVCLGLYELTGFQPGPPGQPQIAVTFAVGQDEALQVSARDVASGAEVLVTASMITM